MYLELIDVVWGALALLAALYAWRAHAVKEQALQHARRHCQAQQVQLLDDSLVVTQRRLIRTAGGGLGWRRRYGFEFTATGNERYRGHVEMAGVRCVAVRLEAHRAPPSMVLGDPGRVIDAEVDGTAAGSGQTGVDPDRRVIELDRWRHRH